MRPEAVLLSEESGAEFPQQPRPRGILYILGSAALLAGGYLMGNLHASEGAFMRLGGLMGKDVIETVLTQDQFKSVFDAATAHMTPAELATTVFTVQDATTVAAPAFTPDVVHLQAWYKAAGRPAGDKTWAQHYMHDKLAAGLVPHPVSPPAKNAPAATTACSTHIASYSQFGHCFSAATAGKTWSHILQVEKEVRTGVGAHGGNGVLHSFYASSAAPEKTLIDAMFDDHSQNHA